VYFVVLAPDAGDPQANPYMRSAYAACKFLQFALPVAWLRFADPAALRPRRLNARGLITGLAFGVGVGVLVAVLYFGWFAGSPAGAELAGRVRYRMTLSGVNSPALYARFAVGLAVLHSLLEEYYWRWFVYGRLRIHLPRAAALILAGLAFMAHHVVILSVFFPTSHWSAVVPMSLATAVGGIFWAWLYDRSGSLAAPWLSHIVVDAVLCWVGYKLVFGMT
jgi:CAAX protease family protein